jgi:hypothetical protein
MTAMKAIACLDAGALALLLEAEANDDLASYSEHLETCVSCQQTLAQLADDRAGWEELVRRLPQANDSAASTSPALERAVVELKNELMLTLIPTNDGAEADGALSLLSAADRPELLGCLGGYEVHEVIGRGGMGVVFKAFDPVLHRLVAIKVMTAAVAGSATARQRFIREARAAAAVCHENVVSVHAVDEANGLPYLVMQYVAGESLQARLDRAGSLEVSEIVRIGLQTASGLAAAHAQGLIHRDIKPANLLLENGLARVRITDFGLARTGDDVQLTRQGEVAGTPQYMAPEQARGETVDHRADLFSLGSVLYACCTGVSPFRGSTALALLRQVNEQAPAPLQTLNPAIPVWLETFIGHLMAKDPARRFQSAAEVAALLEGYLAHLRQPATATAPKLPAAAANSNGNAPPRRPRLTARTWLLAAGGLVGALAIVAAFGWQLLGGSEVAAVGRVTSVAFLANDPKPAVPENGMVCLLINKNSGRCLSIGSSTGKGSRIVQGSPPERAGPGEQWMLLSADKAFRLLNLKSHFVLEIGSANPDHGVQAIQWDDQVNLKNQHWTFEPVEDAYLLRVGHCDLVLCIGQSSLDEGAPAVQWEYVPNVEDQLWELRVLRRGEGLLAPAPVSPVGREEVKIQPVQPQPSGDKVTKTESRNWLPTAVFVTLGAILVLGIPPSVWLGLRRLRRGELQPAEVNETASLPAPAVSFQCSACGKNLRAKAELAGKKVKCTQCAQAVAVPDPPGAVS